MGYLLGFVSSDGLDKIDPEKVPGRAKRADWEPGNGYWEYRLSGLSGHCEERQRRSNLRNRSQSWIATPREARLAMTIFLYLHSDTSALIPVP